MDASTPAELVRLDLSERFEQDLSIVTIIPLHNGARWIEQAISSVLAQTHMPDEFIVVDDGSTDDGPAIVAQLANDYPLIKLMHKPNGGQSAARNFAVARSGSALIALLDQDDYWYPNHLEMLLQPFKTQNGGLPLGWVYSDFDDIDENGDLVRRSFIQIHNKENPKRNVDVILRQGMVIQPSATLISRMAFEHVGGFDERLAGYEDDDLFLRIFRANFDNVYVADCTSQWRIHDSSCGASERHDVSLRIYAAKLLGMYPDDKWRGIYFARDLIAPRFIHTWMIMYARASRYGNTAKMREYMKETLGLVHHLRLTPRILLTIVFTLMRWPAAGRVILAARSFWQRRRRRVLP